MLAAPDRIDSGKRSRLAHGGKLGHLGKDSTAFIAGQQADEHGAEAGQQHACLPLATPAKQAASCLPPAGEAARGIIGAHAAGAYPPVAGLQLLRYRDRDFPFSGVKLVAVEECGIVVLPTILSIKNVRSTAPHPGISRYSYEFLEQGVLMDHDPLAAHEALTALAKEISGANRQR